jgi:4-deoxy-L-threo-5-hexosulose-uronate ketol-isomerase
MKIEIRYASHPDDAAKYDTRRLRQEFLVEKIFFEDEIFMVYSLYDRFMAGGAMPVKEELVLNSPEILKSSFFLERRELGLINVGGVAEVVADGNIMRLDYKDALYLGKDTCTVIFRSVDPSKPAKLYINSAPAHHAFPSRKLALEDAVKANLGSHESSNMRTLNKIIVNGTTETCQLQMGMTELKSGSVWNTMPAHIHLRRMETYFYFEVPENQSVCHFMGRPEETRHIWMANEQAVISPPWSIHSAAGTSNYTFIWGMAGENLDYGDMETWLPGSLR